MNCLEFRRCKLADPRRLPLIAQAHMRGCPACQGFSRGVDETEAELDRVLSTPVPEGLAERVLLRQRSSHGPALGAWGLAAGVLVALAAVLGLVGRTAPEHEYARMAIEHVLREPGALTAVGYEDPAAFASVVDSLDGTLEQPVGRIRHITLCPVGEGIGWHVVFETPQGLATLILVPGRHVESAAVASEGSWNAIVKPMPEGYYAVIGSSAAAARGIDALITQRIHWRAETPSEERPGSDSRHRA